MNGQPRVPPLQAFDHVHVHVADRDAAERWYAEVLGLARSKELELWAVDGGPLTLEDPGGTVHLALFQRPAPCSRTTVALRVGGRELVAWKDHLETVCGLLVVVEDHQLSWSLYFADPDGNPFEITTYEYEDARASLAPSPTVSPR